jgi:hypothetical protein
MNYRKLKLVEDLQTETEQIVDVNRLCNISDYRNGEFIIEDKSNTTHIALSKCYAGKLQDNAFALSCECDWVLVELDLNLYLIPLKKREKK